jgi:hypothetical protein
MAQYLGVGVYYYFRGEATAMTAVFNDAIRDGSVFDPEQLALMKRIFDELCVDHKLTRNEQEQRDMIARAIVEARRISSYPAVLKTAGLKAHIISW